MTKDILDCFSPPVCAGAKGARNDGEEKAFVMTWIPAFAGMTELEDEPEYDG
jgi:hypothetical protein